MSSSPKQPWEGTGSAAVVAADVSDRAGRHLGIVDDIVDDAARVLGVVSISGVPHAILDNGSVVDVQDRSARDMGIITTDAASVTDVTDRSARDIGIVTTDAASVVDVTDRNARLNGIVNPIGSTDSVCGAGQVSTPGALAVIAGITNPGAGVYEIEVSWSAAAPAVAANGRLRHGTTSILTALPMSMAQTKLIRRVTVAGGENIEFVAIAADSGGPYFAAITATKLAA